jgi:hypothetical protein
MFPNIFHGKLLSLEVRVKLLHLEVHGKLLSLEDHLKLLSLEVHVKLLYLEVSEKQYFSFGFKVDKGLCSTSSNGI